MTKIGSLLFSSQAANRSLNKPFQSQTCFQKNTTSYSLVSSCTLSVCTARDKPEAMQLLYEPSHHSVILCSSWVPPSPPLKKLVLFQHRAFLQRSSFAMNPLKERHMQQPCCVMWWYQWIFIFGLKRPTKGHNSSCVEHLLSMQKGPGSILSIFS